MLIATGVYQARDIACPGAGLPGVVPALDYLIASNRTGLGDEVPDFDSGALDAAGKHVVVIGGGDTAMDCVRTAVRQGAASVTCLYRRDRANMPGSMREVKNAEEEGVRFEWLAAPEAFLGDATRHRRARAAHASRPAGRHRPPAGRADPRRRLHAAGRPRDQGARLRPRGPAGGLQRTRPGGHPLGHAEGGPPHHDDGLPGVFAAGDIVRGASLVVWAIRDGRDAAEQIHAFIEARGETPALAAE